MPTFTLPYDTTSLEFGLQDQFETLLILPAHYPAIEKPEERIASVLSHPVDFSWKDFGSAQSVAIAINDKTRPVPHDVILPVLVDHLEKIGVSPSKIRFLIATGTHLRMPSSEYNRVMPQSLVNRFEISSHDIDNLEDLVRVGQTSYGTKVWVNRYFYEAQLRIVVGNIEPHHFAGFSGGVKTAAIGLCGRETINHNHAMLGHPEAWIGKYDTNPLRQDIEEIGKLIKVNLALNVVLNQDQQIADVFAGDPISVMKSGIPQARKICGVQADTHFDLVIASAGGRPKDINFYQAQKALTHASMFANPGAPIILVAACPEGSGNSRYETLMASFRSIDEIFAYFQSNSFEVGPHKALQVARILQRNPVILISTLNVKLVKQLLLKPAHNLQETVNDVLAKLPFPPRIAVLPHATSTLPA
jgi:nickel-dependent lactate racemase